MSAERAFSSPWTLSSPYWIVIAGDGSAAKQWQNTVAAAGLQAISDDKNYFAIQASPEWVGEWERIYGAINASGGSAQLRAAIIASDTVPGIKEVALHLRPLHAVQDVADHLWLLDYLSEDRLVCFLQRVVDRRSKQVGFEAFARIAQEDGTIVGGAAIMRASHALKVEYQVDRHMHKVAVDAFAGSDLEGFLFVNFLTGFIHRPQVYLEGLSQAVDRHHLLPRSIVLDVPLADYARDVSKLRSISDYCRDRGFSMALDDVISAEGLGAVLAEIRPAFVKLDAKLGPAVLDSKRSGSVSEIIRLAHGAGAVVLAESVETEALFNAYMGAGVDMFQGYYFGAPELHRPSGRA